MTISFKILRFSLCLLSFLAVLISGCSAAAGQADPTAILPAEETAPPATPTDPQPVAATVTPAIATEPTSLPGLPAACPQEYAGAWLYVDQEHGFCLLIPSDFAAQSAAESGGYDLLFTGPSYSPPKKSMDTAVATISIVYTGPADGLDSAGYAARWLELYHPGESIPPQDLMIGGTAAAVLDDIPGFFTERSAFITTDGRKYRLSIIPRPEDVAELAEATNRAWKLAVDSLVFFAPQGVLPSVRPEAVCPSETAETRVYLDLVAGYCFQYPADFEPHPEFAGRVDGGPVLAEVEGFGEVRTSLTFGSFGFFPGQTLSQVLEARLEFIDKTSVREITIAKQPALVFVDLRGPWASRQAMIMKDGTVYTILAQPWEPERYPQGVAPLERVWEMAIRTTAFFTPWR